MNVNYFNVFISAVVCFSLMSLVTSDLRWGFLAGLVVLVGGIKYFRVQKRNANDEIEYDERVNDNLRKFTLQSFAFSNLILLVYLLVSQLLFKQHLIQVDYLIIYISLTFMISFFIGPSIVRKR
ncbi:hypothetical protein ABE41_005045 [Fictibacillus arsenicus]|uniref:DUF2178 domain-containing protein n=1 Tax=Fictibacillus arsenicus TaxID=255247 RepID=A0A1B1Z1V2_9BACL|nr:hypothetical protein [Fictibacillus arsenicus]ANX11364.1 hypothetical protein ABE41_005045 [Fictibacillus arsenicus]